jgi:hypothetical protein
MQGAEIDLFEIFFQELTSGKRHCTIEAVDDGKAKTAGGIACSSGARSSSKVICTLEMPGSRLMTSRKIEGGWR